MSRGEALALMVLQVQRYLACTRAPATKSAEIMIRMKSPGITSAPNYTTVKLRLCPGYGAGHYSLMIQHCSIAHITSLLVSTKAGNLIGEGGVR